MRAYPVKLDEYQPAIPALRRLRQKSPEFEAYLGDIVRPCLKQRAREGDINYPM